MSTARLSILLPFRNAESTICEALDSISAQSFENFELIAINDHSEDKSGTLLRSYSDSRFHSIENPGRGLVDALNYGVRNCNTNWVVRMDGDDIMHPDRLALLWQMAAQSPGLDLVASRVEMFPVQNLQKGYKEYIRWQNDVLSQDEISQQIYVESPFVHPSVMFRKSTFNRLGGYREGDFPEDYDLWLRMYANGARMIKIPQVLLYWRDSPERLSRIHPSYSRGAFDKLRSRYLACDRRLKHSLTFAFWGAGRKTRKRSQLLINQGIQPSVWIDIDPKKIGNRIKNISVVDPGWLQHQDPMPFVLIYVTNHGAREDISALLQGFGYKCGEDYLAVG